MQLTKKFAVDELRKGFRLSSPAGFSRLSLHPRYIRLAEKTFVPDDALNEKYRCLWAPCNGDRSLKKLKKYLCDIGNSLSLFLSVSLYFSLCHCVSGRELIKDKS